MADPSLTETLLCVFVLLLTIISIIAYQRSQYWKRRGVPSIGNIIWGDLKNNVLLKQTLGEALRDHYMKYKHLKFTGTFMFGNPMLIIHDPDMIKNVVTKDVQSFGGSGLYYDAKRDPLSANLLFMEGDDWKSMRTNLTPAFTSGKIKYMFSSVLDCISKLHIIIEKERAGKPHTNINARDLMARLATDVILSVTLGIEANSVENPDTKFRKIGKAMFDPTFLNFLKFLFFANVHSAIKVLRWKLAPKETNDFFVEAVRDTIAYREANDVTRNDFLDLMIRLKTHGSLRDGVDLRNGNPEEKSEGNFLTVNEITAQAFFFYLAGFETTSATLSFSLFEIAKHKEVQQKIHAECDVAMKACGGKIDFDIVQSLEYIEMVVQESQRLHPAVAMLNRATLQECTLPGTDIKLEKHTAITIPTLGLNYDPDFFPDPERFDPERFSAENKHSIPHHVFMPFGEGPRLCIGMRFAMMQVKATILSLLSRYHLELAAETPKTIELDPHNLLPAPKFPLIIQFTPRESAKNGW